VTDIKLVHSEIIGESNRIAINFSLAAHVKVHAPTNHGQLIPRPIQTGHKSKP